MTNTFLSRRIALATAVSLTTLACSSVNAQAPYQDTASAPEVSQEVEKEKKGVKIVNRGEVKWKSKDGEKHAYAVASEDGKTVDVKVMMIDSKGGKPHKIKITKRIDGDDVNIDVEGGELTKNDEGHDVVVYVGEDGEKHEYLINVERKGHFVMASRDGETRHRVRRVERVPHVSKRVWVPNAQEIGKKVRIEMERANADIAKAKTELAEALAEVDKEMAEIEDKESAEYMGLEIAKEAIASAMSSLEGQHFDEKKVQFQVHKMNKQLQFHLKEAMEDVHQQREIIIDLQEELHEELEEAREEMHEMMIEIEEMDEGEEREYQLKIITEMEDAMGDMSELRLKALKKAEQELHDARVELEKQIAKQKAKESKEASENKKEEG